MTIPNDMGYGKGFAEIPIGIPGIISIPLESIAGYVPVGKGFMAKGEIRGYLVSGDYETEDGDIKFDSREYHTQTPEEAVREARDEGLIRLVEVKPGEQ